jgi:polysaccharide export outer membrane protein
MTFIASLLMAFTLAQTPVPGQTPPPKPDPSKPDAPTVHYRIGPQDQLKITVFGEDGLDNTYVVDADGSITFPLINRIMAAGLTEAEFQDRIRAKLADGYLRNPQVRVEIFAYKSQSVMVGGEVRTPGRVPMAGTMTLPEALAAAGSPKETASNEVIVTHARKPGADGTVPPPDSVHVNLNDLKLGKTGQDIFLQDGDTIFVPEAQRFYISGQVHNQGSYILGPGLTVQQAIAMAGGLTDRGSDKRVSATRMVNGKPKEVRLKLEDKVQPNDVINVGNKFF